MVEVVVTTYYIVELVLAAAGADVYLEQTAHDVA